MFLYPALTVFLVFISTYHVVDGLIGVAVVEVGDAAVGEGLDQVQPVPHPECRAVKVQWIPFGQVYIHRSYVLQSVN